MPRRNPTASVQAGQPLPPRESRWGVRCAAALIVAAAVGAYANSFYGPFVFGDLPAIRGNPSIRHLASALVAPADTPASGRPVLNLSLALNYAVSGLGVWSYHVFNLGVHCLAGLVLFGIVRRTLLRPALRGKFGEQALPLAWGAALLWTLHPLQTEAVTYVIQRAESLMGLFYLLTLYGFVRGTAEGGTTGRRAWMGLSVAACLLGMGAKEVMVTAPVMVFLYDRTFVAGTFAGAWRRRRGYFLWLSATWLPLGCLVAGTGGNRSGSVGFNVGVAAWRYWLTQFQAIVHYLQLSLWPHPLVFEYGTFWVRGAADVLPYALVLVPLIGLTIVGLWRRPVLGFLGFWIFGILAPSSVPAGTTQMIVEHRMYLSLAGIAVLLTVGIHRLFGRRGWVAVLALAVGCGFGTRRRNRDYRSEEAIWTDTLAKRPNNATAHNDWGEALARAGRPEEAAGEYQRAVQLNPNYAEAHGNLGTALAGEGRLAEAAGEYEAALRLEPDNVEVRNNLGNLRLGQGRLSEAIDEYERALRLQPGFAQGHYNLGNALMRMGRAEEALGHYGEAVRLQPDYVGARYNRANLLSHLGRLEEAIEEYRLVLELAPDNAEARANFGNALFQTGRTAEAARQYGEALRIEPENATIHNDLGSALAVMGRLPEASAEFREALRLRPDSVDARDNLARLEKGPL